MSFLEFVLLLTVSGASTALTAAFFFAVMKWIAYGTLVPSRVRRAQAVPSRRRGQGSPRQASHLHHGPGRSALTRAGAGLRPSRPALSRR
jgi:hypothetical protein